MSLIAVAQHVRGPRTLTRTLLLMVAVTAAIIVGLLAMHALNTHVTATGHAATSTTSSAATDSSAPHHDAQAAAAPASADHSGCSDCGGDHAMAWMACVLALLVSVIVLARMRTGWRISLRDSVVRTVRARWLASAQVTPPPSLTVLCISRT